MPSLTEVATPTMHPASNLTSILPPPPPPQTQHNLYPSPLNNTSWPPSAESYSASLGVPQQHQQQQQQQQIRDDVKDVEMKPLDLSLRAPRQDTTTTWSRSFTSSSSSSSLNSRSQRLSPYPILTPGTGTPRHLGSPCLSASRSPLTRPISPYYPYHRQTPSPYYNYLTGSCTPPENCSSLHVLSSTNRLLNALSSTPSAMLRSSYDDVSSQDGMADSRVKDDAARGDQKGGDVDVEADEPTYIDMDSSATVKSVTSHHRTNYGERPPVYTSGQGSTTTNNNNNMMPHHHHLSSGFLQNGVPAFGQYQTQIGSPLKQETPTAGAVSFSSSSLPSSSLSLISSSSSLASSPSSPSLSRSLASGHHHHHHPMHHCDSSQNGNDNASENRTYPFYNNSSDKTGVVAASAVVGAAGHQSKEQVSTSTLDLNPAFDRTSDIHQHQQHHHHHHQQQQQQHNHHHHHHHNQSLPKGGHHHHHHHHQQQQQQQLEEEDESQQRQQNPDSSSSPAAILDSSSTPSPWRTSTTASSFGSPTSSTHGSSSSSTSGASHTQSPQLSPDSNLSRSSSRSPSNKENIRARAVSSVTTNGNSSRGSGSGVGGANNATTMGTSARRSFFQIDKSLAEENSSSALFSEQLQNEESGRFNVLDFWISKILMEETPRQQCSTEIRQTVGGNRRIRLRLVDLIELQVEQSLKA